MTDPATELQNVAAKPDQSTWLSANAGSGKTRVLTNRVARLLLHGVNPQNILCLTYTKAAASEMQNRLFKTLGSWAMLSDHKLQAELAVLGETTATDLSRARTLFASAIEAPGGLKIQTIHALCSSILRQFPLEAGVSPQFREMEEAQQSALIEQVLDGLADANAPELHNVARVYPGETLTALARDVARKAEAFPENRSMKDIYDAFGVAPGQTVQNLVDETLTKDDIAFLKSLVPILSQSEKPTDAKLAEAFLGLSDAPNADTLEMLESVLLTKKLPFSAKITALPTKGMRESNAFQPLLPEFQTIMQSVETARPIRLAILAAEQTVAIHDFSKAFLPAYAVAKKDAGLLDFDDLIRHTRALLTKQSMQWVMYRLDGRIDHILVDEAQDTSPAQWDVIEALAEEMSSGEAERSRTLFVVGDKKQSIYSFQGADAAGFDIRADTFHARMADGQGLQKAELAYSFRSSPAILNVVDHVFGANDGLNARHMAYHGEMPGRVDLWPLIKRAENPDEMKWTDTGDRTVANAASKELAEAVATKIEEIIGKETILGENGPKLIESGDIMVLVQRRSALFDDIIQACKSKKLQIAGADRLKLASELAVRDLLALLSFLAFPDDSLSLAAALRSPLFGWSEQDLYRLASPRNKAMPLWAELRRRQEDFPETHAILSELRDKVDFSRPFELLDLILTRFEGRVRLLERLGPEAEDGMNELLNQALAYERDDVPSLTGFLDIAQASDIEIKRQSDTSGDLIRVMTVHGAKGLESPVVILPDTTFGNPGHSSDLIVSDGLPVYPMSNDASPSNVAAAKSAKKTADQQERERLLYVAMTRAEKWLIVCGVEPATNAPKGVKNWHKMVEEGLERAGAKPFDDGLRYAFGTWPKEQVKAVTETVSPTSELPNFDAAPRAPARKEMRSPSDLGGAKVIGGGALDEADAKRRGRQIHLLLENLPGSTDPMRTAERLLSFGPDAAPVEQIPDLLNEAQTALAKNPEIFVPEALAEVAIVAELPTLGATISGTIDLLLVNDDRVLAVDFKTNAVVPDAPEQTPEGLLRQMGAYLEALEQIYADLKIELAILWTATGELMPLEHGIVRAALQRTPTS